jgi:hypothetical protein
MHLQNAITVAPVSRKPSTELRRRLQIQRCWRRDRLPAAIQREANLKQKCRKGTQYNRNSLGSPGKNQKCTISDGYRQRRQAQRRKGATGQAWKSRGGAIVLGGSGGSITPIPTDFLGGPPARLDPACASVSSLCEPTACVLLCNLRNRGHASTIGT